MRSALRVASDRSRYTIRLRSADVRARSRRRARQFTPRASPVGEPAISPAPCVVSRALLTSIRQRRGFFSGRNNSPLIRPVQIGSPYLRSKENSRQLEKWAPEAVQLAIWEYCSQAGLLEL